MKPTQVMPPQSNPPASISWAGRIGLALLFAGLGFLIIHVFSSYRPLLSDTNDALGRLALAVGLVAGALLAYRDERLRPYAPVLTGLLIMHAAVSLDKYVSFYLVEHLTLNWNTPQAYALQKIVNLAAVALAVVLLTRLSGGSLASIYVHKGNLRLGLTIGLTAFLLAAAAAIPMANLIFKASNLTWERVVGWLPWVLIFVFANAANEELLFRGLFLRKLEPFYGRLGANLLIMLVFTVLHLGVTYTSDQVGFIAVLVPLALAWGWITQKTDALWGSILFHAGMDLPVILGILSNL